MPKEDIRYLFDKEAKALALQCLEKKFKGVEWMKPSDLALIAFIRTTAEPPRSLNKVTLGKMEDIDNIRMSEDAQALLGLYAGELRYVCWLFDKSYGLVLDEEKLITIHHELKHVPPSFESHGVIDHDVEDFVDVMEQHPERYYYKIVRRVAEAMRKKSEESKIGE